MLKPNMTPDDHAAHAEELLETARGYHPTAPIQASLERQAIAHAMLSLRKPEPKPRPKKTTTPKKKATPKETGS